MPETKTKPLTIKTFGELLMVKHTARSKHWFHKPSLATLQEAGLVELLDGSDQFRITTAGALALTKPEDIKLSGANLDRLLAVRAGHITRNGMGWTDSFSHEQHGTIAYPLMCDMHHAGFIDAELLDPKAGGWAKHRITITELGNKMLERTPNAMQRAVLENLRAGRAMDTDLTPGPAYDKAVVFIFRFQWASRTFHRDRAYPWTEHITEHGHRALELV